MTISEGTLAAPTSAALTQCSLRRPMYQRQLIPFTVVATSPYKQEAALLVMLRRSHSCHRGLRMRVRAIRVLWRALKCLAVRSLPTLAAEIHDVGADHQVLS